MPIESGLPVNWNFSIIMLDFFWSLFLVQTLALRVSPRSLVSPHHHRPKPGKMVGQLSKVSPAHGFIVETSRPPLESLSPVCQCRIIRIDVLL